MKKIVPIVLLLVIVGDSDCGVVDGLTGILTDTTRGVTQDVKYMWTYGKNVILGQKAKTEKTQKGLIGGWIQTSRDTFHRIREYVWNNEDAPAQGNSFVERMYNRVKNSIIKIKKYFFLKDEMLSINVDNHDSEETKLVRETLQRLFFNNGTRRVHGKAFNDAIGDLKHRLLNVRNDLKKSVTTAAPTTSENPLEEAILQKIRDSKSFNPLINPDKQWTADYIYDKGANKMSAANKRLKEASDNFQAVVTTPNDV